MGFVLIDGPLDDMVNEDAAPLACHRIADAVGDRLESLTKRFTPVDSSIYRDKPGRARGAARASVHRGPVVVSERVRGDAYKVTVSTEDPVFPFIEWNTKPHIIRPRKDRRPASVVETGKPRGTVKDGRASLSWRGPGGRFYAKEVHHPGTTGQHPFARAALQVSGSVPAIAARPVHQFERDLLHHRLDVTL